MQEIKLQDYIIDSLELGLNIKLLLIAKVGYDLVN